MKREQRKAAGRRLPGTQGDGGHLCRLGLGSGQRWVGRAADVDTIRNRLWFTLRHGNCPHPTLQAAWDAQGSAAFALEIVERLDEETLGYVRDRMLKDQLAYWCSALGAEAI